jgi:hypothetical protein
LLRTLTSKLDQADLSRGRRTDRDARWLQAERARLLGSDAFRLAKLRGVEAITPQAADAFFRVDDYVVGSAREQKIVRILDASARIPS